MSQTARQSKTHRLFASGSACRGKLLEAKRNSNRNALTANQHMDFFQNGNKTGNIFLFLTHFSRLSYDVRSAGDFFQFPMFMWMAALL